MSTPTHGAPASDGAVGTRDGGSVKATIVEAGPSTVPDLDRRVVAAVLHGRCGRGGSVLSAPTAWAAGPVVAPTLVRCTQRRDAKEGGGTG